MTPLLLLTLAAPPFVEANCLGCHSPEQKAGNLDLSALPYPPDGETAKRWVRVYDRVAAGEMPPRKKPPAGEFLAELSVALTARETGDRSVRRRLTADEFENALRDLFAAPWLQVKSRLPEDGEADCTNESAAALEVSPVFLARALGAADYAMRQAISVRLANLSPTSTRYHARDQRSMADFPPRLTSPVIDKKRFPVRGTAADPDARLGKRPADAVGAVMSAFAPGASYGWEEFRAPVAGRYRLRVNGHAIWVGVQKDRPHLPDYDTVSVGRRSEPMAVYTRGGQSSRQVATFDLPPTEGAVEVGEVWLVAGESVVTDPARFYRRRGGAAQNPLATADGMPGIALRWLEVEGPLPGSEAGYRLLFGDRPVSATAPPMKEDARPKPTGRAARGGTPKDALDGWTVEVPAGDPEPLLRGFLANAYRRPVTDDDVAPLLALVRGRLAAGLGFGEAMLAGYAAALLSPGFLLTAPHMDDHALAERLALFLWNGPPDAALRAKADAGKLRESAVLKAETDRLLDDPRSRRFVVAFLDYWADARKLDATAPSETLYGDYVLDDGLREAALAETRAFFAYLLANDRPARELIDSDTLFLNERLARHYGVPGVEGVQIRKVPRPSGSVRGGLLTQALVLKVTANGTTTSPVLRGKWVVEHLLGEEPPPPPPVPAVEPDIRGAVTIREQLAKHRADASCATCHARIDPPGFALESFDVLGGWRDRYRAVAEGKAPAAGRTKEGHPLGHVAGPPVDCGGELADGRRFADVRELKRLLLADEERVARALLRNLVLTGTGAAVRFRDRPAVERILADTKPGGYGVRSLVHGLVQSELFQTK